MRQTYGCRCAEQGEEARVTESSDVTSEGGCRDPVGSWGGHLLPVSHSLQQRIPQTGAYCALRTSPHVTPPTDGPAQHRQCLAVGVNEIVGKGGRAAAGIDGRDKAGGIGLAEEPADETELLCLGLGSAATELNRAPVF
ncbi:hypothetical protein AAFF_G00122820 [Aldrovandia affinis]|uniref:Uncharacterized protein n=1 Tax=Aldrovandia affinis TaxID=143900 RepID=A0AAD7RU89_9TELE|nr:hypothetical protein AAFF_G00122820 [Aldrovandia affinis]